MSQEKNTQIEQDRQLLRDARATGGFSQLRAFARLSGPGWLQSAITLGGGSLAGSLFLGVISGYTLLWLQPMAIAMGVVMLSAIGYVTLSTGEKPFQAINNHINPVLGWSWAIATLMANMVWSLPQFALSTAALQQNLLPGVLGKQSAMGEFNGKLVICVALLLLCTAMVWIYDSGGWGIKFFDRSLKALVGMIVICFFGVVVKLAFSEQGLPWGEIFAGFVPDPKNLTEPAAGFTPLLANVPEQFRSFWSTYIVSQQRDVMITAAATAVGINMTFLLPYSMLSRGWDKEFRGLAIFDLATGMAIPYVLVTSCVVIAAANRFHTQPGAGLEDTTVEAPGRFLKQYQKLLDTRLLQELPAKEFANLSDKQRQQKRLALPAGDRALAARLVKRDGFDLAATLTPLTGSMVANVVFGLGVLGMGVSTIIILMLISGFVICEMFGFPQGGWYHRIGCMAAGIGVLGPFIWTEVKFRAAVPTSVFGLILLPIAYFTFFLMMNQRSMLGDNMPKGGKRVMWNLAMGVSALAATFGAGWSVWSKAGWAGFAAVAALLGLALYVQFTRKRPAASS